MNEQEVNLKVKELNDYFRDRIVSGDYEIIERKEHTYIIKILDYTFVLWIANGADYFAHYQDGEGNFMQIEYRSEDRKKAFSIIKKDMEETILKQKEEREKREFERLKQKYQSDEQNKEQKTA